MPSSFATVRQEAPEVRRDSIRARLANTRGRPSFLPLLRAVARPALTRSEMRIRSCLATVAMMAITASPEQQHVEFPLAGIGKHSLELFAIGNLAGLVVDVLGDNGPAAASGELPQLAKLILHFLAFVFGGNPGVECATELRYCV